MKPVMQVYQAYIGFLNLLSRITGLIVVAMLLLVCSDLLLRYLFNNPLNFTIEISELFLAWIVALGMAWLLKEDGHIRMDVVTGLFPQRVQALLDSVTSAMSAFFLIIVTFYGFKRTLSLMEMGVIQSYTVLRIPSGLYLIPLLMGCFLLAIQFMIRTYQSWQKVARPEKKIQAP